jgi:hypothetical protein
VAIDPRLIVLAVALVLGATRLRWMLLGSWAAGMGGAWLAFGWLGDEPGGVPDEIIGWLIRLVLKFLLVMIFCEAAAAAVIGRGRLIAALVGAAAGKAGFILLVLRRPSAHDGILFLMALAASGAVGATLGSALTDSRRAGGRRPPGATPPRD